MPNIIGSVLSFFTNPIADLTGGYRERKRLVTESTARVVDAEINLKVARLSAKTKRYENQQETDSSYDLKVLENRNRTPMDEVLIGTFLIIWLFHFLPFTQSIMLSGWVAMGYKGAPWWFEFGMVGILVSTLGLMQLFRIMFAKAKPAKASGANSG